MVALIADACFLHEPTKGKGDTDKEQRESRVSTRLLPPSAVLAFCGLLSQIEPSTNAGQKPTSPEPPQWTDRVQAISAGLVAALTIVLLIITGKQFSLLIRSTQAAESAAENAKIAADAAVESAGASSRQASLAERAFRDLERPYVFVDSLKYLRTDLHEGNSSGILLLTLANYGRTPAIMWEVEARVSAYQVPDANEGAAFSDNHRVPISHILTAGSKFPDINVSGRMLDEYFVSGIQKGTTRLSVKLHIRYGNVFDNDIREDVFPLAFDYALQAFLRDDDIPATAARHDDEQWREEQKFRAIFDSPEDKPPGGAL